MPVIPATWEAEVGESLEPRRRGGCSEPRFYHCSTFWAVRAKLHLQKEKEECACVPPFSITLAPITGMGALIQRNIKETSATVSLEPEI